MNRRAFLTGAKQVSAKTTAGRSLASGLENYSGAWTKNEVIHLLKRTMFGAKKSDVDHFLTLSVEDAVNELLTVQPASPPLRDYIQIEDAGVIHDDPGVLLGNTWINDLNTLTADIGVKSHINSLRIESIRKWWVGLMVNQQRSIQEKMVLFWHHHFSVQKEEVENCTHLYRHHDLIRRNVLGNIRELTKEVTVDPAMLRHLNGYLNSKQAPDENYGRELQELFTVGKGNDSLYTESDVREAARVLTGWRIDSETLLSYFQPGSHDTGTKTFSAFYNNTVIGGSNDGLSEVDQLINMIFATTETSKFICRKLYKWFVYYQIDENTEANVIVPLAEILRNNHFEIKPVLAALLKSAHFFDPGNQACYIKSPFDFVVGTLREFEVSFPAYNDYSNGYPIFFSIYKKAAEMQQDLLQPPDVSGWPSYYQDPMYYEMWVNSNTLPKRAAFTDDLIKDQVIDLQAFAARSADPLNAEQLINDISFWLLRYPLSDHSKLYIRDHFLVDPGDVTSLQNTFRFILNLPEYHLC